MHALHSPLHALLSYSHASIPSLIRAHCVRGAGLEDILVDEPVSPVGEPRTSVRRAVLPTVLPVVRAGAGTQVCRYEEVAENVHSDCSAEDFDILVDLAPKTKRRQQVSAASVHLARTRGAKDGRSVEKRSLLTDVDLLVS